MQPDVKIEASGIPTAAEVSNTCFILWAHRAENVPQVIEHVRAVIEKRRDAQSLRFLYESIGSREGLARISNAINGFLEGSIPVGKLKAACGYDVAASCLAMGKGLYELQEETGVTISFSFIDRSSRETSDKRARNFRESCRRVASLDKIPASCLRLACRSPSALAAQLLKRWEHAINSLSVLIGSDRNARMFEQVTEEGKALGPRSLLIAAVGDTHAEVAFRFDREVADTEICQMVLPQEFERLIPVQYRQVIPLGCFAHTGARHAASRIKYSLSESEIFTVIFDAYVKHALAAMGNKFSKDFHDEDTRLIATSIKTNSKVRAFLASRLVDTFEPEAREAFMRSIFNRFLNTGSLFSGFRAFASREIINEVFVPIANNPWSDGHAEEFLSAFMKNLFPVQPAIPAFAE